MSASKLWIIAKLSDRQAMIILAALSEINITDARDEQLALLKELSKQFERRWPDLYRDAIRSGVFADWRDTALDRMNESELREAALASL